MSKQTNKHEASAAADKSAHSPAETEKRRIHDLTLRYTRAITALNDLKRIRDYVTAGAGTAAAMPGLARKIRSAIKSAQGAVNNAHRFAFKARA
jgi:hypothetical protein